MLGPAARDADGTARRSVVWVPLALMVAAMTPGGLAAADQPPAIGRSVVVVSDVEGHLGDAPPKRILINDDVVFQEDLVTGDEAKTVIEFRDGSTFEVGPDSAVRIDSFVFNPDESVSRKAVEVGRGVFRYISGLAAADQDTRISTAGGTLAIRGSVVSGIVDPDVPTFLYVGEGRAVFTNDAGRTPMEGGGAIAVPSRTTTPVRPTAMPAAIVAQALQAIDRRLPTAEQSRHRPPASAIWLRQAGSANLLPTAEQATREAAAAGRGPLASPAGRSRVSGEVKLLVEANRRNLFDGAQTRHTPEQQAFLAQAARAVPHASALIARATLQAAVAHRIATLAASRTVMRGIAAAAPSSEVLRRVVKAATNANPSLASAIRQTATAASRAPVRAAGRAPAGGAAGQTASRQPAAAEGRRRTREMSPTMPASAQPGRRSTRSSPTQRSATARPLAPQSKRPHATAGPPARATARPERGARGSRPAQQRPEGRRDRRPEDQSPR